jgi:hypothetical protein
MAFVNYIITLIILIGTGIIYDKYKIKNKIDEDIDNYELIKKYLLNDSSLANAKKPILWVHINYEENARHWHDFVSRKSTDLNQPYLYLSISSIINHCGESFNIVLIDDNTFNKILPGWSHELNRLPDPIKGHFRQLAISQMLNNYGGMIVPSSFICMKDLIKIYYDGIEKTGMFVGEFVNKNVTSQYGVSNFYTTTSFMGCKKENPYMQDLIKHIEILISTDYTDEMNFQGKINSVCNKFVLEHKATLIDGCDLGIKTTRNEPIAIDDLLGNTYIKFKKNIYGVYIPADEILKRSKFEWFSRMNINQVLNRDTIVGKLLLSKTRIILFVNNDNSISSS